MKNKILCIEDNATIQVLVTESLKDFDVICAGSILEAKNILKETTFNALLIDIHLPDGDGLRFLTELSQDSLFKKIPILIFSDHAEISNKVMAFTFGAEDFISKPFDPIELHARISSKIKKFNQFESETKIRNLADLLIDFDRQKVFQLIKGKEKDLNLTSYEMKILGMLTKRLEQVYSREQIMNHVWGDTFISDRTVDSHIAHLRKKIEGTKIEVDTVKNLGYRACLKP